MPNHALMEDWSFLPVGFLSSLLTLMFWTDCMCPLLPIWLIYLWSENSRPSRNVTLPLQMPLLENAAQLMCVLNSLGLENLLLITNSDQAVVAVETELFPLCLCALFFLCYFILWFNHSTPPPIARFISFWSRDNRFWSTAYSITQSAINHFSLLFFFHLLQH